MFQITGVFAEFERGVIRQRVRARAKRGLWGGDRRLAGRRSLLEVEAGKAILATAKELGVGTGTVHRIARAIGPFESAAT